MDKIESLFSQLDAGVAALEQARTLLGRYRQAVLKAAFEGQLTADWRAEHRAELEPADELLARLRAERARRGGKPPKALPPLDASALPPLPEGWCWARLGEMFDIKPGSTPSRSEPAYWNGDVNWVSSGEVRNDRIWATEERITELGLDSTSAVVHPPGTVLIAMIGQGKTRGKAAILDTHAATNQNVSAIQCADTPIVPEYIFGWLMSQYEHNRTVGAGGMQMALSATRVANLSMPICSQQEQHRVASLVSQAVSLIDREVTTVNSLLARAARLRQAILKRAFEGRLVPQDPADEPAAQLLERIRTARAAAGAGSPGPRRQGRQRQDRRPRQSRPPKPERLL